MDESVEILKTSVSELRTIVAKLVGLPVGVFRLTTSDDRELFDQHTLDRYDLEIGKYSGVSHTMFKISTVSIMCHFFATMICVVQDFVIYFIERKPACKQFKICIHPFGYLKQPPICNQKVSNK